MSSTKFSLGLEAAERLIAEHGYEAAGVSALVHGRRDHLIRPDGPLPRTYSNTPIA